LLQNWYVEILDGILASNLKMETLLRIYVHSGTTLYGFQSSLDFSFIVYSQILATYNEALISNSYTLAPEMQCFSPYPDRPMLDFYPSRPVALRLDSEMYRGQDCSTDIR